jgi:uncharacterized membrane protein
MDLEKLQYFPLALPHFSLLALIFLVLVAWIEVQALRSAYLSMGLGPHAALILLLASLAGSYLNIPVARLSGEQIVSGQEVWYFGMRYVIPEVISRPGTVIAVNVGGALIPGLLSTFLYLRNRLWISAVIATIAVAAVCHWLARPVPGLGIALPVFVPPLSAAAIALLLSRRDAAPLAYISGKYFRAVGKPGRSGRRSTSAGTSLSRPHPPFAAPELSASQTSSRADGRRTSRERSSGAALFGWPERK